MRTSGSCRLVDVSSAIYSTQVDRGRKIPSSLVGLECVVEVSRNIERFFRNSPYGFEAIVARYGKCRSPLRVS